jgi:hypothetical protein
VREGREGEVRSDRSDFSLRCIGLKIKLYRFFFILIVNIEILNEKVHLYKKLLTSLGS